MGYEVKRPSLVLAFILGVIGACFYVVTVVYRAKRKEETLEDKLFAAHFTSTPPTQLVPLKRKKQ